MNAPATDLSAQAIHVDAFCIAYRQRQDALSLLKQLNQLAKAVMKAMDVEGEVMHVEARNEAVNAWSDHSKAERVFGKRPGTSLDEGLRRMADWAKRTGARESKHFGHIEIEEKLPAFWVKK